MKNYFCPQLQIFDLDSVDSILTSIDKGDNFIDDSFFDD